MEYNLQLLIYFITELWPIIHCFNYEVWNAPADTSKVNDDIQGLKTLQHSFTS